ncbi:MULTISPECIES: HlyD family secretion protein [Psychrilyobacter]|uniref:HlyD family efflux transporter periplasmic adaptor subunit n=1 Tax=Psychrilyobacter piezotolerans TaxID=2293438 RepID=A0ABX9KDW5_9FUSO|nr:MULTISPECIES: HlyD family efflux transporter periplasmic adaptor subunit [Psychrilyobacter]MCS5422475.1 HlyD family efflux transporter periplasmic adaptor subunit [Psychrilyobacter sp. S5]NDI79017.1 HlyD family efflux transporter periplasmic adaptor subunit [Psychrilyobacter piezotolerans]RDE59100.1 HlyD family efflux transporter periplasmic adaptor subunit [Psychrilyobacter sp. S5]REI39671.1 HlyD family efflux transporter periplasmic adaptor subunit [Psychrilyobacter piezotolerans]
MSKKMMTIKEYELTTDYFFRKELRLMIFYIYFLTSLIILLLTWSYFFNIDILVKSRGVVRPIKKISSILNQFEGNLTKVNYQDGKKVKKDDLLYSIDTFILENNYLKNSDLLRKEEKEIYFLATLKESLVAKKSFFKDKDNEYYYLYQKQKYKDKRLEAILRAAKMEYLKYKALGSDYVSEMDLEKYRRAYEEALYNYKMSDAELLSEINNKIFTLKEKTENIIKENIDLKNQIEKGSVKAPITGTIQCSKVFNKGDYIPKDQKVLDIVPQGSKLKMIVDIANKDISKIKVGQLIKYRIDSLLYKEYGISKGKVVKISPDSSNKGSFRMEGTIDREILENNQGDRESLKIGMTSDIRIVTTQKSILRVILEKLNFMNE